MKTCSQCRTEKPATAYRQRTDRKGGDGTCRQCRTEQERLTRASRREKNRTDLYTTLHTPSRSDETVANDLKRRRDRGDRYCERGARCVAVRELGHAAKLRSTSEDEVCERCGEEKRGVA